MKPSRTRGAVLVGALLCTAVTACGTAHPADPAAVAPPKPSAAAAQPCGDETTEEGTPGPPTDGDAGSPGPPTDAAAGNPGPPTDGDAGDAGPSTDEKAGTPGPPTDADTGNPGPPTDVDAGTPGPPTDADTGNPGPPTDVDAGTPGPPTDADPGTPGPPTDGTAKPCLPAGWFDMTREFTGYYAQHLTKADDGMWPSVAAVRIRKQGGTEEAVVTVTFVPLGGSDADGRRVAEVFADWRHEAYDDKGTLRVETRSGGLVTEESW